MSIEQIVNQMKQHAQMVLSDVAFTKIGIISAYNPTNYTAKVILQPQDPTDPNPNSTGSLPIYTPWSGNGWGMFSPPAPGDMCAVHFVDGSYQDGFVSLTAFNLLNRPMNVESGEFWLVHKTGASVKLLNDGTIEINSELVKIGNIEGLLMKLLNETAKDVFNSHTHVVSGSATLIPTEQMTDASLTQNVEAT